MIEFVRSRDCNGCDSIESALKEMVIAHKVTIYNVGDRSNRPDMNYTPPLLLDNGTLIQGHSKIQSHLEILEERLAEWSKFQSDACYIDDDGDVC